MTASEAYRAGRVEIFDVQVFLQLDFNAVDFSLRENERRTVGNADEAAVEETPKLRKRRCPMVSLGEVFTGGTGSIRVTLDEIVLSDDLEIFQRGVRPVSQRPL